MRKLRDRVRNICRQFPYAFERCPARKRAGNRADFERDCSSQFRIVVNERPEMVAVGFSSAFCHRSLPLTKRPRADRAKGASDNGLMLYEFHPTSDAHAGRARLSAELYRSRRFVAAGGRRHDSPK